MRKLRTVLLTLVVVGMLVASTASAAPNGGPAGVAASVAGDPPIPVDAPGWTFFNWGPDGLNIEGPFTFSSTRSVVVKVTDGFCRGDQFEVFDSGASVGTTSAVAVDAQCDDVPEIVDPDVAFADSTYSHGAFVLAPGSHAITIRAIVNPFAGGGAWLRVDTLPLPTTKDQCKRGGWRSFGTTFRNQGQCVAFVQRGPKP
jgi:hypothetical protein